MEGLASCQILWSTQSGRAKACARRSIRILREQSTVSLTSMGCAFDDVEAGFLQLVSILPSGSFLLIFVSTTGDGEHCDSIRDTWVKLLQKSLPKNLFEGKRFAIYCLGDRAYGPQFCAAGRKLAVRLMQLGMKTICEVGYGDDNTPNGGVFRDLDDWLERQLLPTLEKRENPLDLVSNDLVHPYCVQVEAVTPTDDADTEWMEPKYRDSFQDYFSQFCPVTSYTYDTKLGRTGAHSESKQRPPLLGSMISNERITSTDWNQDTRHIRIHLDRSMDPNAPTENGPKHEEAKSMLPYQAGDVAAIIPFNSDAEVNRFISVLPDRLQHIVDHTLHIAIDEAVMNKSFVRWPRCCTFRGWLKFCADIHSFPEREDLRALSPFCSDDDSDSTAGTAFQEQSHKLRSLSETTEAGLYADYILREKRSWADVLYDFQSLRAPGSKLTLEALLVLIPPMRPRAFSIASAPSTSLMKPEERSEGSFAIGFCVAVVKGRTPLGRNYVGLCSDYLSRLVATFPGSDVSSSKLLCWIRPGTFGKLPLALVDETAFEFATPVVYVGAGTGVAPMRSLLREREAVRELAIRSSPMSISQCNRVDNILVFGCRSKKSDFYYREEWETLVDSKRLRLLTAFSRDQFQKIYVQRVLREADDGRLIAKHLLHQNGALYIAGGPKMTRAVKEEVVEALGMEMGGGEKQALQFLNKLQRLGRFSVEAWS